VHGLEICAKFVVVFRKKRNLRFLAAIGLAADSEPQSAMRFDRSIVEPALPVSGMATSAGAP
jgi:hypothetical protein